MQYADACCINFHRWRINTARGTHQREHDCVNDKDVKNKRLWGRKDQIKLHRMKRTYCIKYKPLYMGWEAEWEKLICHSGAQVDKRGRRWKDLQKRENDVPLLEKSEKKKWQRALKCLHLQFAWYVNKVSVTAVCYSSPEIYQQSHSLLQCALLALSLNHVLSLQVS